MRTRFVKSCSKFCGIANKAFDVRLIVLDEVVTKLEDVHEETSK